MPTEYKTKSTDRAKWSVDSLKMPLNLLKIELWELMTPHEILKLLNGL